MVQYIPEDCSPLTRIDYENVTKNGTCFVFVFVFVEIPFDWILNMWKYRK